MLKPYFLQLGFVFPIDENPADVYLEIITRPKAAPAAPDKSLTEIWETSEFHSRYLTQPHLDIANASDGRTPRHAADTMLDGSGFLDRVKNTSWMCLYLIVSPICLAVDNVYRAFLAFRGPRCVYNALMRDPLNSGSGGWEITHSTWQMHRMMRSFVCCQDFSLSSISASIAAFSNAPEQPFAFFSSMRSMLFQVQSKTSPPFEFMLSV